MRSIHKNLAVITGLTVALGFSAATEQSAISDTQAGRALNAWLDAFNSGDREIYRNFLAKNFPSRLEKIDEELGFRDDTGGFDLRKIETSAPTKLTALVQERLSDQFARLVLEVESAEPFRITSLDLRAIPRPVEFALPYLSETELIANLRAKLEQEATADRSR